MNLAIDEEISAGDNFQLIFVKYEALDKLSRMQTNNYDEIH